MSGGFDAQGRRILLTGATDGIGLATARRLAASGADLIAHGRNPVKLAALLNELRGAPGAISCHLADFSSLADVARLGREIREAFPTLDVVINNAGIGPGPAGEGRELSRDGNELRFQVNHLASALLSRIVAGSLAPGSRIVYVASGAQEPIDPDDPGFERGYDGFKAYCRSKLAMVMDAFDLAGAMGPAGVAVNALHPGSLLDTKLVRESFDQVWGSSDSGADAILNLALSPALEGVTGLFFNETAPAEPHPAARDPAARVWLRGETERLIGPYLTTTRVPSGTRL
jgi:NAD(P)-dependent dehydrogenase (short-subunit alcohol dehydrogenase family)